MADVTGNTGLPLWSDHVAFLRRHRAWIVALVVLGLLAGLALSMVQSRTYSATASVALTPVPVYVKTSVDGLVPPEVSIDTDAQLLGSPEVLGAVGRVLGLSDAAAGDAIAVSAAPLSHVLHVTISAPSRTQAADAANAAVDALIDRRRETLGALQASQLRELRLTLRSYERELAKEQAQRLVLTDRDELFAEVLEMQAASDELDAVRSVPADVISPASPPSRTDYANAEVPAVSGALLGLLVALSIGLVRDRLRPRTAASLSLSVPALAVPTS